MQRAPCLLSLCLRWPQWLSSEGSWQRVRQGAATGCGASCHRQKRGAMCLRQTTAHSHRSRAPGAAAGRTRCRPWLHLLLQHSSHSSWRSGGGSYHGLANSMKRTACRMMSSSCWAAGEHACARCVPLLALTCQGRCRRVCLEWYSGVCFELFASAPCRPMVDAEAAAPQRAATNSRRRQFMPPQQLLAGATPPAPGSPPRADFAAGTNCRPVTVQSLS